MHDPLAGVLTLLRKRCEQSETQGGDGFISTYTLKFDAGINTRGIRRILDEGVTAGALERRSAGPGKGYCYRVKR